MIPLLLAAWLYLGAHIAIGEALAEPIDNPPAPTETWETPAP